jgi:MoaA/NifB/PqqE/SkfB family radical SAM enzyme
MVQGTLHRLHVSVDSPERETYKIIRQRDCLDLVITNVKKIQDYKRQNNVKWPKIAFNTVLMKMNIGQLPRLVELAAELEVDEVNCTDFSVPERYRSGSPQKGLRYLPETFSLVQEQVDFDSDEAREILSQAYRIAKKNGIFLNTPRKMSLFHSPVSRKMALLTHLLQKSRNFPVQCALNAGVLYLRNFITFTKVFCTYPWRQMVLLPDGRVIPCCVWDESKGTLGSTTERSILDVWNGSEYDSLRASLIDGQPPAQCISCTRARTKERHGI